MAVPTLPVSPGLNAPPSGGTSGDLYVARVYGYKNASGAWTPATFTDGAWTSLGATNTVAGSSVGSHLYWLIRGASEPDFSITANGADAGTGYECFRVTGAHATTPVSDTDAVNGNSSGSPLTLTPSVVVPTDGLVLMFAVNWTSDSWEDPAGYTARGSASGEVETWSKSDASGTTQTPSVTNGNNSDQGAVHMVAIAPAAASSLSVIGSTPADDGVGVGINAAITITYSHAISDGGSGSYYLRKSSDNSLVESFSTGQFVIAGSTVTITPASPRLYVTGYYVEADAGVVERTSDSDPSPAISGATTWNFTTELVPSGGLTDPRMPWSWARARARARSGLVTEVKAPWLVNTMWAEDPIIVDPTVDGNAALIGAYF